MHGENPKLSD